MLDVAIVGGGLCGLALAHSLHARGFDWRLFEARERFGGRILTARGSQGTPVDLGATWFWPATQPGITRLVADLGLEAFEQHDDGRVLHLDDAGRPPRTVALTPSLLPAADDSVPAAPAGVHGGACRVAGGAAAIVEAFVRRLPPSRLRTGWRLEALVDHGDAVELRLREGGATQAILARRVVLALPPRVIDDGMRFDPPLPGELQDRLRATPTWMATAAKAGFVYPTAFWRDDGHTGNAWVSHAQAMLAEVFDACGPDPAAEAALAGFAALDPAQRATFARGRAILLESQVVQLFGPQAAGAETFWQDWAASPETCSSADLADAAGATDHPAYGDPALQAPAWGGRLYFGGSETARQGGGYMEGALAVAARLRRQLADAAARPAQAQEVGSRAAREASAPRARAANDPAASAR